MVLSTVMSRIHSVVGCNDNMSGPAKLISPQLYNCSESEDGKIALRLPSVDTRHPLENDARDLMTDSDSDQQQQTALPSPSSSFPDSFDHIPTELDPPPSQPVYDPFDASPPVGARGRRGNRGIEAARQRFLLEKATKLQEAKLASEDLKVRYHTSETSSNSSAPLYNRPGAREFSSSVRSTLRPTAQQDAKPRTATPPASQSMYARGPTALATITDGVNNQSCRHSELNSTFQRPLPELSNNSSSLSSAMIGRDHRVQSDWAIGQYLFVRVCDLPDNTTTRDLWAAFKHEGHIAHIRLQENAYGLRNGRASVKFRYASKYSPSPSHRDD